MTRFSLDSRGRRARISVAAGNALANFIGLGYYWSGRIRVPKTVHQGRRQAGVTNQRIKVTAF